MNRRILLPFALLALIIILSSWGSTGHSMISFRVGLFFNEEMADFEEWIFYLSEHASDADWRKGDDPEEGPKHYIDIDNYSSFLEEGQILQSLEECESTYGTEFVKDNGYLPWATLASYDSVVACLEKGDWNRAKYFAADLGHYVADGHMPLHLTKNYNGQLTGNTGIHARYEIDMIGKYQDQINYTGSPAKATQDVSGYVFSYIYENYRYMDSLIIADDYAREMAESTTSDLYYVALWERSEYLTKLMFERASLSIAELIYTAWIEAGKPSKSGLGLNPEQSFEEYGLCLKPNPVNTDFSVKLNAPSQGKTYASICDLSGRKICMHTSPSWNQEQNELSWDASGLNNGFHFFQLQIKDRVLSVPFLVAH